MANNIETRVKKLFPDYVVVDSKEGSYLLKRERKYGKLKLYKPITQGYLEENKFVEILDAVEKKDFELLMKNIVYIRKKGLFYRLLNSVLPKNDSDIKAAEQTSKENKEAADKKDADKKAAEVQAKKDKEDKEAFEAAKKKTIEEDKKIAAEEKANADKQAKEAKKK